MEDICSAVLEVSQTIMQQILHEFEESEPDRQHELLALGEKVLQLSEDGIIRRCMSELVQSVRRKCQC